MQRPLIRRQFFRVACRRHERAETFHLRGPDAVETHEVVDRRVRTAGDDLNCSRRTDAGERLEFVLCRGVDVYAERALGRA